MTVDYIAEQLRPLAVEIEKLVPDPANARTHPEANITALKASLRVYGQRKPVVVNKRNMVIEAGNGTYTAAKELGWTHLAAVLVDDDPMTATGFAITDNRVAELAEWDKETLDKLLNELEVVDEELAAALDDLAEQEGLEEPPGTADAEPQIDRAAELQKKWQTAQGQLWLIGEHRLLCGDSTKREDVERVMGGERAGLCFTSPPYAQQRDYREKSENVSDWDSLMNGVFQNLPMADDGQVLVNLGLVHRECEWIPYWEKWIEWMRGQGWRRFGWYVWDQGSGLPGDWSGRLAPSHEFVFHFNKKAIKPIKWEEKASESIRDRTGDAAMRGDAEFTQRMGNGAASLCPTKVPDSVIRVQRQCGPVMKGQHHPAVFSIGLPQYVIESWPGHLYEPFAGSGTTLVASQNLSRRCYGIEISPAYCAVILERMKTAFPTLDIRQA